MAVREAAVAGIDRTAFSKCSGRTPLAMAARVGEIIRETIHRLLAVALPEAGASAHTVINRRTRLSAMLQMARDHGYRSDNLALGIRLKHPPFKPARAFARLGVSTGARYCELISFVPEDSGRPSSKTEHARTRRRICHR
jgi:hypothetical protein